MRSHHVSEFVPTIIDSKPLLPRLAAELGFLETEIKSAWPELKRHPLHLSLSLSRRLIRTSGRFLLAPNVVVALLIVMLTVLTIILVEQKFPQTVEAEEKQEIMADLTFVNLKEPDHTSNDGGIGRGGKGQVGFQQNNGGGSGEVTRRSQGGGGSGNHELLPAQTGKLPPPSIIPAAIPKTPAFVASLPAAGIDIDPALWRDIKSPVYGDPRSTSNVSSRGPGNGGTFGSGDGTGIGEGNGPGVGPGQNGNMGGNDKQIGCCGPSGAKGDHPSFDQRIFRGTEVEQRARLLSKPEPQYTEEARRNQVTGTVLLRVVFSSLGQVEQIKAVQSLPFGLTERAIAAARQIRFMPATKSGKPVSVYMQLEYNFNLY